VGDMQNRSERDAKAIFVCQLSLFSALEKSISFVVILLILMSFLSANVVADENLNNTVPIDIEITREQQMILNDWSEKMATSINQKMAQQIKVKMLEIIVQAEETRLFDTQTRQFADKNRVGSQPTIGHSEPDFLKH